MVICRESPDNSYVDKATIAAADRSGSGGKVSARFGRPIYAASGNAHRQSRKLISATMQKLTPRVAMLVLVAALGSFTNGMFLNVRGPALDTIKV